MKTIYLYTELGECKPKGFYKSLAKMSREVNVHPNTLRNQFKTQGFYSGKKGTLTKITEL